MKNSKKSATFRLPERTLVELRQVADIYSCSQADVIETYSTFFTSLLFPDRPLVCGSLVEMFVSRFGDPKF